MNPYLAPRVAGERQKEYELMAGAQRRRPGRGSRRGRLARPVGLALVQAGRWLAGPDEAERRLRHLALSSTKRQ